MSCTNEVRSAEVRSAVFWFRPSEWGVSGHRNSVTLRVAGQLRHIGVGRTYARTDVILLVQDLHVTVIDAATGELLREFTLNPTIDYQPQNPRNR